MRPQFCLWKCADCLQKKEMRIRYRNQVSETMRETFVVIGGCFVQKRKKLGGIRLRQVYLTRLYRDFLLLFYLVYLGLEMGELALNHALD